MTTTTTRTLAAAFPARTRPRSRSLVATAAVGYSVAWLTGLAVPAPEFDLDAAPGAVLAGATAHGGLIAGRALLVLGVAAVALAIVAVALARAMASGGERRLSRAALAAGLGAAAVSAVQLVL